MADHDAILELASALVAGLRGAGKSVATAESCTGGWVAKAITDVAGSSEVFAYGVASYSNDAKQALLGVNEETLENHGAVSEPVVREMAEGIVRLSGADIGVAVSGIAGPEGGTIDKPVGTVCFAWALRRDSHIDVTTERQSFTGDRERVREQTVLHILTGVLERL